MALRPPRTGPSVARRLSERARALRDADSGDKTGSGGKTDRDGILGEMGGTIAGVGVSGMLDALRGLVDALSQAAQDAAEPDTGHGAGPREAGGREASVRSGARRVDLGGQASAVFGYTLRMGADGLRAEPFGDVAQAAQGGVGQAGAGQAGAGQAGVDQAGVGRRPAAPVARQPITEVFDDGGVVTVVAELPGADAASIRCTPQATTLLIEAQGAMPGPSLQEGSLQGGSGGGRRYRKELALPAAVRADGMRQSFNNGILEVRLERADAPTPGPGPAGPR